MQDTIINLLTDEEKKQIIRVHGPNFSYSDIPAYLRKEKQAEFEQRKTEAKIDKLKEEELTDMFGEGGKEEIKEYYEN